MLAMKDDLLWQKIVAKDNAHIGTIVHSASKKRHQIATVRALFSSKGLV
jgi:hypothetical protein